MKVNIESTTYVGGTDQESFSEELKEVVSQEIRSAGFDPDEVEIEEFHYEAENFEKTHNVEIEVRSK